MRVVALVLALLTLLTACGSSERRMVGSLMLNDAFSTGSDMGQGKYPCIGTGGYSDISEGSPVTVYDAAGSIVATGVLASGTPLNAAEACVFSFDIAGLPAESEFYQVEVANRGRVTFSKDAVDQNRVSLTLGSSSGS